MMKLYRTRITKFGLIIDKIIYRTNKPKDTIEYLYLTDSDLNDPAITNNIVKFKDVFQQMQVTSVKTDTSDLKNTF